MSKQEPLSTKQQKPRSDRYLRMSSSSKSRRGKNQIRRQESGWEEWGGYMTAKRQKLNDQFMSDRTDDTSDIFKGIVIHVNGYTKPSSDELKKLMMLHGGGYEHFMSKTRVTHVIASSLANSKMKDFKHVKIVLPDWITDSVEAKRLLSYIPYQLYTAQTGMQQGLASFTSNLTRVHSTNSSSTGNNQSKEDIVDFLDEDSHQGKLSMTTNSSNLHNPIDMYSSSIVDLDTETFSMVNDNIDSGTPSVNTENCINDKLFTEGTDKDNDLLPSFQSNHDNKNNRHFGIQREATFTIDVTKNDNQRETTLTIDMTKNDNKKLMDICETDVIDSADINNTVGVDSVNLVKGTASASTPTKSSTSNHSPGSRHARAGDPEFLSEFYNNSRLHHLSTWKSEWRTYVNKLQKQGSTFPGRLKLHALVKQMADDVTKRVNSPMHACTGKPQRVIMHIDMDCFFVSVGLRTRPEMRGKSVVVTHSKGKGMPVETPGSDVNFERKLWELRKQQGGKKGKRKSLPVSEQPSLDYDHNDIDEVYNIPGDYNKTVLQSTGQTFHSMADIASCSYEARKAGVKNGMSMGKARQLCPELLTIPYDFDGYQEVSKLLYDTVASYTHDIEAVSCDEMLVDCTDLLSDTGAEPLDFAKLLRDEIYSKTGCTASAGMGPNILSAKMATRKAKPNGQHYLHPDEVLEFLSEQSIENIPGVGWSMSRKLHDMGVTTCGDLQKVSLSTLKSEFGVKTGQSLYSYSRGQDNRPIKMEQERKSVSAEINYGIRLKTDSEAVHFLTELSEEVHNRLANIEMKGKSITLKIMARRSDAPIETAKFMGHGICNNTSKSVMLPIATDDSKIISRECISILRNMKVKATDLRGIGIQVQKLEPVSVTSGGVKGAQSILNFAVSRHSVGDKAGNQGKPDTSAVRLSPLTDKPKFSNIDTGNENKLKTRSENLPVLILPLAEETQHETTDNVNLEFPDDSADDLEEEEIHHGIVEELARRKTAKKILPPLPVLPDLSLTPEGDDVLTSSGRPVRKRKPIFREATCNDYFPSPSQIDPEVLKELPPDVRKQIEDEIKSRQKGKKNRTKISSDSSQTPGCSHWSNLNSYFTSQSQSTNQNKDNRDMNQSDDVIVPLPSPSQLDESCLNALPVDLQKELQEAYALQKEQEKSKLCKSSWLQLKSPQKKYPSPKKAQSPGKGKKNSPVFKVPQSRPGRGRMKLSPKKLNFQKQPKITSTASSKKDNFPVLDEPDNQLGLKNSSSASSCLVDEKGTTSSPSSNEKRVNLCGAVSIAEVRALLREWLQSSPVPEADDEEMMIEYLKDLVYDYNLEQVDLVIKFLNRNIKKLTSLEWNTSLRHIIDAVQIVVQALYGGPLALPDDITILPNG